MSLGLEIQEISQSQHPMNLPVSISLGLDIHKISKSCWFIRQRKAKQKESNQKLKKLKENSKIDYQNTEIIQNVSHLKRPRFRASKKQWPVYFENQRTPSNPKILHIKKWFKPGIIVFFSFR